MSGHRKKSINEKRDSAALQKEKPAPVLKGASKAEGKKQRTGKEEKKAGKDAPGAKEQKEKKGKARGDGNLRSAKGKEVGASVEVGEVSKIRRSKEDVKKIEAKPEK